MTRRPPKCRLCHVPVVFYRNAIGDKWRMFDVAPVDGRGYTGGQAQPVEGERAWRLRDLVEDLMARRQVSREDAEKEAYDVPWYVRHKCAAMPAAVKPEGAPV